MIDQMPSLAMPRSIVHPSAYFRFCVLQVLRTSGSWNARGQLVSCVGINHCVRHLRRERAQHRDRGLSVRGNRHFRSTRSPLLFNSDWIANGAIRSQASSAVEICAVESWAWNAKNLNLAGRQAVILCLEPANRRQEEAEVCSQLKPKQSLMNRSRSARLCTAWTGRWVGGVLVPPLQLGFWCFKVSFGLSRTFGIVFQLKSDEDRAVG